MSNIVVHGLSIFPENDKLCRIRATIRMGDVQAGQVLTYKTPEGKQFSLTVKKRREGPSRHVTLFMEGDTDALTHYKGGYYLYGENS